MTTETLHQFVAILRRIRGLSVPAGTDWGHSEIAALSKDALELLEKDADMDEVFRLRRLSENQARALDHWRRLSDEDAVRIRGLTRALETAAVRLEILTGRMRACHEETGKHELLGEAEGFCKEARAAAGKG